MADKTDVTNTIDETPISPSRPDSARKNSLEYHLSHRPERQELVESAWHVVPCSA
jgi:hypothetical protein